VPFQITTEVDCYLLLEDGAAARTTFLQHLNDPHEMYIIAYAFTLREMIDELIADAPDPRLHIYLDYSQSTGKAESPLVQQLVNAGLEVTIGTSTAGQRFICPHKGYRLQRRSARVVLGRLRQLLRVGVATSQHRDVLPLTGVLRCVLASIPKLALLCVDSRA